MKHLLSILCVVLLATCLPAFAAAMPYVFTRLSAQDGLSDNQVQHILQLPDGRMVFTTRATSTSTTACSSVTSTATTPTCMA